MADTTDKTVRTYLSNLLQNATGKLIEIWYDDSESLEAMQKFSKNIGLLHRGETVLIETRGTGVAQYESPYCAIWICPKDIAGRTSPRTTNQDKLDGWVTAVGNAVEASNGNSTRPWSAPAIITAYGIGNSEDVIGLPGEKDFKNTLIIYAWISIRYNRIFNC